MCDIGDLHNTLSQTSYDEMLKGIIDKWKNDKDLSDFAEYFHRQWINSKFCNWQLFKTPVGFSMTNSPIESYNNKIKESFTKRKEVVSRRFKLNPFNHRLTKAVGHR
jgi:hypothetical protein